MPTADKINGVEIDDIEKINGVPKSSIEEVNGVELGSPVAMRWVVGSTSGKIFHSPASNAAANWAELIDLGGETFKSVAYGQDNSGNPRVILHAANNADEIAYANDGGADLTDSNNWSSVNHSTNYKATDQGPSIAWGNNVWIQGGATAARTVGATTYYHGPLKSTDGGATWTKIDVNNTVNSGIGAVCYKSGTTWLMTIKDSVWKSTDAGDSWSEVGVIESGKRIQSMAYNGSRWVAVLDSDNIWYSDDDWSNSTEVTNGAWVGTWKPTGVVYAAGSINKWVVCGNNGRLAYSGDATSFTTIWAGDDTDWETSHIRAIATDHTTIVIVGDTGKIATSSNGTSFTIRSIAGNPTNALWSVASDVIGAGMR